jgi:hypothetical protein
MQVQAVQVQALDESTVKNAAIGIIVVLLVVGIGLSLIIQAIVGRIIVLVVAIVLGIVVWSQRSSLENKVKNCDTNVSFFGYHVQLSKSVKAHCPSLH